jgi:hypothetical protein
MKTATEKYVIIKTLPHYGEKAVIRGKRRVNAENQIEVEAILMDCTHGEHVIWIKREDI